MRHHLLRGCPLCGDQMRDLSHSGIANFIGEDVLAGSFLYTSPTLYLTPAPGGLSPGYVILAPRTHRLNFGQLGREALTEAAAVVSAVKSTFSDQGPFVVFEHGALSEGETGAACVSHAHLHIAPVPRPDELHEELERRFDGEPLDGLRSLGEQPVMCPYLAVETGSACIRYIGENMESQLLRKLIASQLGRPEQWNWRQFPQRENYVATIRGYLGRLGAFREGCGRRYAAEN